MNARWYRVAVVVWALLYAWWSTLPFTAYKQSALVRAAMEEYHGRGAIIPLNDTFADFLLLVTVIAAGGLFFFRPWGRVLFVVTTAVSVVLTPFFGIAVAGPFDGALGFLMTLINGALLAIVFWSPVAGRFMASDDFEESDAAGVETQLVTVYEAADRQTASVIGSLLASGGIEYITRGNPPDGGIRFLVRRADELFAKDVIELGYDAAPVAVEPAPN